MLVDPDSLYRIPKGVQTRWASAENWKGEKGAGGQENGGRKGSAAFPLGPGESKVLAGVTGASGTVRRIWMTFRDRSARMLRGMRLDFHWDGCAKPAVSVPLGDFFMHGLGRMATFETALFSSPEGRSCNCFVPMPFKTGMKVVLTNETTRAQGSVYYDVNYTLGDNHEDGTPYFHACSVWVMFRSVDRLTSPPVGEIVRSPALSTVNEA